MKLLKLKEYKNIYAVDTFEKKYNEMFKNNKDVVEYKKKLAFNLTFLDNAQNLQVALKHNNFEHIKNTELYAIRHVSNLNPRVFFFCVKDNNTYILLHSFLERERKDYKIAIKEAENILLSLNEQQ